MRRISIQRCTRYEISFGGLVSVPSKKHSSIPAFHRCHEPVTTERYVALYNGINAPTVARTLTSPTSTLCGLRSMTKRAQRNALTIPLPSNGTQMTRDDRETLIVVCRGQAYAIKCSSNLASAALLLERSPAKTFQRVFFYELATRLTRSNGYSPKCVEIPPLPYGQHRPVRHSRALHHGRIKLHNTVGIW